MTIGEKLHRLRARAGDSYAKVGRVVSRSTNAIRDVEAGRTAQPSIQFAAGIARHYGVPLDWLADDAQGWPPPLSEKDKAVELVERALAGGGLAGELTDAERDLLAAFRSMTPEQRSRALGYVIGMRAGGSEAAADLGAELGEAVDQTRDERGGTGRRSQRAGGERG